MFAMSSSIGLSVLGDTLGYAGRFWRSGQWTGHRGIGPCCGVLRNGSQSRRDAAELQCAWRRLSGECEL